MKIKEAGIPNTISIESVRLDPQQCQSQSLGIPRLGVSENMPEIGTMHGLPDGGVPLAPPTEKQPIIDAIRTSINAPLASTFKYRGLTKEGSGTGTRWGPAQSSPDVERTPAQVPKSVRVMSATDVERISAQVSKSVSVMSGTDVGGTAAQVPKSGRVMSTREVARTAAHVPNIGFSRSATEVGRTAAHVPTMCFIRSATDVGRTPANDESVTDVGRTAVQICNDGLDGASAQGGHQKYVVDRLVEQRKRAGQTQYG